MGLSFIDKFHIWRKRMRWDRQYKKGKWEFLKNDLESHRYSKIAEYIKLYGAKNPSILDLGCGEGILNEYVSDVNYKHFLGVDYSKVSIANAKQKGFKNSDFLVADLHHYTPHSKFDVIIFNEAFYYVFDSEKANVLSTMLNSLENGGIIITSIFNEGTGCWEYFDIDRLEKKNFEKVSPSKKGTYWQVGAYKKIS